MRPSQPPIEGFFPLLWHYASTDRVPARSLKVALIVGTALNLINQGDAIFGQAPISWMKLGLTFAMPYVVSTYGAVAARWDGRATMPPLSR
jgi:hypothetical protein